jgi:hypothetical protein
VTITVEDTEADGPRAQEQEEEEGIGGDRPVSPR